MYILQALHTAKKEVNKIALYVIYNRDNPSPDRFNRYEIRQSYEVPYDSYYGVDVSNLC